MNFWAKHFTVEGSTSQYLIAKAGTADHTMATASAVTDAFLGVVTQPGETVAGEGADVVLIGEAEVRCGGPVSPGDSLTVDSSGRAVAATTGQKAVGKALISGTEGAVIPCLVCPHTA